jgi:murein DD-endopeptidase MepM/ murein hydrolase activator NlpD
MAKTKFRYNPHTLSFEPISIPFVKKLANVLIQFVLSLFVAVIVFFSYTYFFDTPKEKILQRENSELALKFELLGIKLEESVSILGEMQQRDNHIYRAIFEADTIPSSLRMGGIGGVDRYNNLSRFRNSGLLIDIATKLDQVTWKTYIQSKSFDEVIDLAKNKEKMIVSIPAIQPISYNDLNRISDYFGGRRDPFTRERSFHQGIDFAGPIGVPIYAAGNGKVITAEFSFFGYGNVILIDHGFGYQTRYAHLKKIGVKVGDTVVRGQRIGSLGNSGRSTGPHLHYEVIYRNRTVDPLNYFNEMSPDEYEAMVGKVNSVDK